MQYSYNRGCHLVWSKRWHSHATWKRRYVTLSHLGLQYSATPDSVVLGQVPFCFAGAIVVVRPAPNLRTPSGYSHAFAVTTTGVDGGAMASDSESKLSALRRLRSSVNHVHDNLELAAQSKPEMDAWIPAVKRAAKAAEEDMAAATAQEGEKGSKLPLPRASTVAGNLLWNTHDATGRLGDHGQGMQLAKFGTKVGA